MPDRRPRVVVTDDVAGVFAERVAEQVRAGGHVALTGGRTPRAGYEQLAGLDLDWGATTLWFGDERCVPPDDERSNYGMVKSALLDRLPPGPPPQVERMEGERGPADGAAAYAAALRATFGEGMPALDLVLLGIGADGHCASLYPGQPEVEETEHAVVGVERAGVEPFVARVSLTLSAIDAGRAVVFAASGERKAAAIASAVTGDRTVPAGRVAPASGDLEFILDPAAAAHLPREAR